MSAQQSLKRVEMSLLTSKGMQVILKQDLSSPEIVFFFKSREA